MARRHRTKDQKRVTGGIPDPNSLNAHWGAPHARQIHDLLKKHSLLWKGAHFRNRFSSANSNTRFQAYWELYLYDALHAKGLEPQLHAYDQGPDFKCRMKNDQIIWIEAVAPSMPQTSCSDRPYSYHDRVVQTLAKKHVQLYENQERQSSDLCVIAINLALLSHSGSSAMNPHQNITDICHSAAYQNLMKEGNIEGVLFSGFHFEMPDASSRLYYVSNTIDARPTPLACLFDILHKIG